MLIDITMANFRSIKDPQTLSFAALRDKRMNQSKVHVVSDKLKILRTAAVIGPNGVGKSTVVRALETVKAIITAEATDENPLRRILAGSIFAYNDVKNQPAEFTLRFLLREATELEPEIVATYSVKQTLTISGKKVSTTISGLPKNSCLTESQLKALMKTLHTKSAGENSTEATKRGTRKP